MVLTGLVLPAELKTPAQQAFQSDALGWGWGYRALDFDEAFFEATKSRGRTGLADWSGREHGFST